MATGFEKYDIKMLLAVRGNLLQGLEKAAEHERNGTLDYSDDPHTCPPRAGRDLTVAVLGLLDRELWDRELAARTGPSRRMAQSTVSNTVPKGV